MACGDRFAGWKMIVSMVALRCCYDQCNLCREKKDAAGGVTYGRSKKIPSAAAGLRAQSGWGIAMTGDDRAPLLLLAPGAEYDGEEIWQERRLDQLLVQRRDWSHYWIAAAASTCFQWLRGCESAMAARAEDDAAVEAGDGCVLVQNSEKNCLFGMWSKAPDAACGSRFWLVLRKVAGPWGRIWWWWGEAKRKKERMTLWFSGCSGDRGKICFGFENGDGKGSVWLKVGGRERVWKFVLMGGFFYWGEGKTLLRKGEGLWKEPKTEASGGSLLFPSFF